MKALLTWTVVLFVFGGPALAAETFDAVAAARTVAPLIEKETIAVVHGELSRVEIEPVLSLLSRLVPDAADEFARNGKPAAGALALLRRAGVKDGYLVVTLSNQSMLPKAVLAFSDVAKIDRASLAMLPLPAGQQRGSLLVIPLHPAGAIEELQPAVRPELAEALAAAGDSAIQAVLIPPASMRRVIAEVMPQLPPQVGGGPSSVLTRGALWDALALDLSPQIAVRLTVKSQDAAAAAALRAKWLDALKRLRQEKSIQDVLPEFDALAAIVDPKVAGDRLVLNLNEEDEAVNRVLVRAIQRARQAAMREQSMNNLKQIALAMHGYHEARKHFPAPASQGPAGKPLLSWRVAILPYLGEEPLYKQFHLDESWDSPHNKTLIDKMPSAFRSARPQAAKGRTAYVVPISQGALYASLTDEPQLKDITDGTANTIMVAEVDDPHAVVWTKPDDFSFDPKDPAKGIGSPHENGFNAAFCDGSVRLIPKTIDAKTLKALITRAGGEVVSGY